MHYVVGKNPSYQFIADASKLQMIPSSKYNFLLASRCLEHVVNPLCAFQEWLRIPKKKGVIFLALPDKGGTFDPGPPATALSHLVSDREMQTPEDDFTHLDDPHTS
jgi:ubiquinone/menaquinone biosynthesis C-methylase UbiE